MAQEEMDQVATESVAFTPPELREADDSVDLVELFRKLRRGRKMILTAALFCFVVATTIAFVLPARYTSTASFVPPVLNSSSSMATALAGQISSLGGAGDILGAVKNPGELYAGVLRSRSIADELIKQFDLMSVYKVTKESQAEKVLSADTDIAVDMKTGIVTLGVTEKDAGLAQNLARAYMDALRETNGRLALSQSSQRRLFFGQQLAKEKDDLEDAEVELKRTEETSGLIAPSGQTAVQIETIAQTQGQIALRQVQLAALRESSTEENPEVIRLRSEIGNLQGQLARLQNGSGKQSSLAIPTSKVPELQLEYVRKEREVKYHEALFDMLSRQYEAARLDESRDAPVLQLLDPASYPDSKSSPKRLYIMLSGLVLGFLASSVWVLIRDPIRSLHAALASGGAG